MLVWSEGNIGFGADDCALSASVAASAAARSAAREASSGDDGDLAASVGGVWEISGVEVEAIGVVFAVNVALTGSSARNLDTVEKDEAGRLGVHLGASAGLRKPKNGCIRGIVN